MSVQEAYAAGLTLAKAKKALIKAYTDRQKRYAKSVHGRGCFNEEHMAKQITALENRIEDLGGDPSAIYADFKWRTL